MNLPDPRAHYTQDARLRAAELSRLRKGGRIYIAVKLASFILGLFGFSRYLSLRPSLAIALLAGFAAVFSAAAILHERLIRRTAAEKRLLQVDEEELRALDGEFDGVEQRVCARVGKPVGVHRRVQDALPAQLEGEGQPAVDDHPNVALHLGVEVPGHHVGDRRHDPLHLPLVVHFVDAP